MKVSVLDGVILRPLPPSTSSTLETRLHSPRAGGWKILLWEKICFLTFEGPPIISQVLSDHHYPVVKPSDVELPLTSLTLECD